MYEEQAKEFAKKVYEERKKKVEEEKTKKENEIYQHVMNIMAIFSYSTNNEPRIREIDLLPPSKKEDEYVQINLIGEDGEYFGIEVWTKVIQEAIEVTKIPRELWAEIYDYFQKNLSDYFRVDVNATGDMIGIYLKEDITICEKEEAEK